MRVDDLPVWKWPTPGPIELPVNIFMLRVLERNFILPGWNTELEPTSGHPSRPSMITMTNPDGRAMRWGFEYVDGECRTAQTWFDCGEGFQPLEPMK